MANGEWNLPQCCISSTLMLLPTVSAVVLIWQCSRQRQCLQEEIYFILTWHVRSLSLSIIIKNNGSHGNTREVRVYEKSVPVFWALMEHTNISKVIYGAHSAHTVRFETKVCTFSIATPTIEDARNIWLETCKIFHHTCPLTLKNSSILLNTPRRRRVRNCLPMTRCKLWFLKTKVPAQHNSHSNQRRWAW